MLKHCFYNGCEENSDTNNNNNTTAGDNKLAVLTGRKKKSKDWRRQSDTNSMATDTILKTPLGAPPCTTYTSVRWVMACVWAGRWKDHVKLIVCCMRDNCHVLYNIHQTWACSCQWGFTVFSGIVLISALVYTTYCECTCQMKFIQPLSDEVLRKEIKQSFTSISGEECSWFILCNVHYLCDKCNFHLKMIKTK